MEIRRGIKRNLSLLTLAAICTWTEPQRFSELYIFNPRQVEPPIEWNLWHTELQTCTGLEQPFEGVNDWFWADSLHYEGVSKVGLYQWNKNFWDKKISIFLVPNTSSSREQQVKHELLHYLTDGGGHKAFIEHGGCILP